MIAYKFYRRDPLRDDRCIGVLPERRKHSERITQASVMKWIKSLLSSTSKEDFNRKIYFVQTLSAPPTLLFQRQGHHGSAFLVSQ